MSLLAILRAKKQNLLAATLTVATDATHEGIQAPTVARVAPVTVATPEKTPWVANASVSLAPATDPDRWCWPHSLAWNSKEIDTFTARLVRFTDKGLSLADAESEADRLVIRDRECDDRRLCLECSHLQGTDRWRCGNWQAANVARDRLSRVLVLMLQRCRGFMPLGDNSDQRGICQLISENHPLQGR